MLLFSAAIFFSSVSSFKALIPEFNPFHWDTRFYQIDHWLHGGTSPWAILQRVASPWLSCVLNAIYNLWFFLMQAALFWYFFFANHDHRRQQFLLSFIACWVINGCLLAAAFSSVGPAFYGRLMPLQADPFGDLMTYLHTANNSYPIWALATQDYLWQLFKDGENGLGGEISAMPSMHVSVAFLLCCAVWHLGTVARIVGLLFVGLILVGSIHLGWHYAVDGYLALLTSALIWKVCGVALVGRRQPRLAPTLAGASPPQAL